MIIGVTLASMNTRRAYSSQVRQEKAAATRQRIIDAARELFADPAHDFTLERTAAMAGVSVQTVLRAFGNKEHLILEAVGTFRQSEGRQVIRPARTVEDAVATLFDDYEQIGDRVIRMLAEEHRIPGFAAVAAGGRRVQDEHHRMRGFAGVGAGGRRMARGWVEATCAPQLKAHPARHRAGILVALLAATDVYVWKLLRRDLGLDRSAAQSTVARLIRGTLGNSKET